MSAEQVLRAAIVKTLFSFTYQDWPSTWWTPNR
jgi:hypothetical protein